MKRVYNIFTVCVMVMMLVMMACHKECSEFVNGITMVILLVWALIAPFCMAHFYGKEQ